MKTAFFAPSIVFEYFRRSLNNGDDLRIVVEPDAKSHYEMWLLKDINDYLLVFPDYERCMKTSPYLSKRDLYELGILDPVAVNIFLDCFNLYFGGSAEHFEWKGTVYHAPHMG